MFYLNNLVLFEKFTLIPRLNCCKTHWGKGIVKQIIFRDHRLCWRTLHLFMKLLLLLLTRGGVTQVQLFCWLRNCFSASLRTGDSATTAMMVTICCGRLCLQVVLVSGAITVSLLKLLCGKFIFLEASTEVHEIKLHSES